METQDYQPLRAGDRVRFSDFVGGATGIVLKRLRDGYLQVLWSDSEVPMTHRASSLRKTEVPGLGAGGASCCPPPSDLWPGA
jgi:hypothetical protein